MSPVVTTQHNLKYHQLNTTSGFDTKIVYTPPHTYHIKSTAVKVLKHFGPW